MDSDSFANGRLSGPRCSCGRVAVFERVMTNRVALYTQPFQHVL
jgi:hypothetical protein